MRIIVVFLIIILSLAKGLLAQSNGALNAVMINKMHKKYRELPNQKALENAISNNSLKDLALNRENLSAYDTYFSNKVVVNGITDQKSSGRCWLFTGLNVIRPVAAEKLKLSDIQFSQNYLFFYDQLEKSNLFLQGIIETAKLPLNDRKVEWFMKNPIGDGGQWTGVVELINKYGVVPSEIMPETYHSENTAFLNQILSSKLREQGLKLRSMYNDKATLQALNDVKIEMLSEVYQILALCLGQPPLQFDWRYKDNSGVLTQSKNYTPTTFYNEYVGIKLQDYVMFMNDPSRPYNTLYEIEYDRHNYEGGNWKYINLDIESIKKFAIESIKGNKAMYFSCDVGKQLDSKRGYLDLNNYNYSELFSLNFNMDKKARIETFESGSSHGMSLVAVDLNAESKPSKWLLENSWGQKGYKGYLIMTDEWFNEYMFRIVIHKDFVNPEILKILSSKAILLPPWDPMFKAEE